MPRKPPASMSTLRSLGVTPTLRPSTGKKSFMDKSTGAPSTFHYLLYLVHWIICLYHIPHLLCDDKLWNNQICTTSSNASAVWQASKWNKTSHVALYWKVYTIIWQNIMNITYTCSKVQSSENNYITVYVIYIRWLKQNITKATFYVNINSDRRRNIYIWRTKAKKKTNKLRNTKKESKKGQELLFLSSRIWTPLAAVMACKKTWQYASAFHNPGGK